MKEKKKKIHKTSAAGHTRFSLFFNLGHREATCFIFVYNWSSTSIAHASVLYLQIYVYINSFADALLIITDWEKNNDDKWNIKQMMKKKKVKK